MGYQKNEVTNAAVAVATEDVIATIAVSVSRGSVVLAIKNTGDHAFDSFQVEVQVVEGGDWYVVATAAGEYTTLVLPLVYCRTTPYTLAASAVSLIQIDVRGLNGIRLSASANTTATTASVWSNFSGVVER